MKAWAFTLTLLRCLLPYEDRALELSTPPEILQKLREDGAILDWCAIKELGDDHDVPEFLAADELYNFLEWYTNTGCGEARRQQFAARKGGSGGRLERSGIDDSKTCTHVIYQFGADVDGGLYKTMIHDRDTLEERLAAYRDCGGPGLSAQQLHTLLMLQRLIRFFEAEKERLSRLQRMAVTVVHVIAYLRPGGVSNHRDTRLDSPLSRRVILPCPSSRTAAPGERQKRRLSFFVGRKGPGGRLDTRTARCFGKCGGNVLVTGQGSGGFPLIPPAVDGLAWWLWHHPWASDDPGAEWTIQASMVFSGYAVPAAQ